MKRMHVHVAVDDLSSSIGFYSALFAAEPSVVKPDYAKWMLDDPRVNFAISARICGSRHCAARMVQALSSWSILLLAMAAPAREVVELPRRRTALRAAMVALRTAWLEMREMAGRLEAAVEGGRGAGGGGLFAGIAG